MYYILLAFSLKVLGQINVFIILLYVLKYLIKYLIKYFIIIIKIIMNINNYILENKVMLDSGIYI